MGYLLASVAVLLVSLLLFKRAAGTLSPLKPNLISLIFYYNVLAQTFIAAVLAVLDLDNHYVIGSTSEEVRVYAWLSVMYMMVAFPLGMLIAKSLFARRQSMGELLHNYVVAPVGVKGVYGNSLRYSVWVFTVVSILACVYTFWRIGYFPFVKVWTSSASELISARISVSRDFSGNVYVRNLLALSLMPVLSYVWMFYYIATRRLTDILMVGVTVLFSASILYYDFSKAPLLWYFISFIFVYFYALGRVRGSHIVVSGALAFFGLVLMYSLSGVSMAAFASYNSGPVGRVVLGQSAGLFVVFDIFPGRYDFIGFSSLSNLLSTLFNYEYVDRAARIAMAHFRPSAVADGEAGVMNSIFIAEAWANFGVIGILLSPFWVGFILQSLYIFFLRRPKNPVYLSFFVSFSVGGSVTGGFNDYIYNPGVLFMVVLFVLIMVFALWIQCLSDFKYKNARNI